MAHRTGAPSSRDRTERSLHHGGGSCLHRHQRPLGQPALFQPAHPATGKINTHIATTREPAIPSAFASIISAIKGLSDVPVYPMHHTRLVTPADGSSAVPQATSGTGDHFITPNDFAVL
jgi:hypothetical protein